MDLNRNIDIISFLHQFFLAHQCTILSIGANHLHVQLTKELDQALMNRPFYWQYIEATGRLGEPKSLAFTTNMTEESTQMEWIHHGSPRLHQIYEYIQKNNRIIQLFEVHQTNQNTDRKSTRLNSSHVAISYAVFCLKKKKQKFNKTNGHGTRNECHTRKRSKRGVSRSQSNS